MPRRHTRTNTAAENGKSLPGSDIGPCCPDLSVDGTVGNLWGKWPVPRISATRIRRPPVAAGVMAGVRRNSMLAQVPCLRNSAPLQLPGGTPATGPSKHPLEPLWATRRDGVLCWTGPARRQNRSEPSKFPALRLVYASRSREIPLFFPHTSCRRWSIISWVSVSSGGPSHLVASLVGTEPSMALLALR